MTREEILKVAKPILLNTEMVRAILDGRKTVTRRPIKLKYDNTHIELRDGRYGKYVIELQNDVEGETYGRNPDETSFRKLLAKRGIKHLYKVGDYLYVRETWGISNLDYENSTAYIIYKASENKKEAGCQEIKLPQDKFDKLYKSMAENSPDWRPSTHMPKEAARIFLRVTDVRVERLQDMITDDYRTPINFTKEGWWNSCNYCPNTTIECRDFVSRHSSQCILIYEFGLYWNSTVKKSDLAKYGWDANPWVWVIEFERVEVEL